MQRRERGTLDARVPVVQQLHHQVELGRLERAGHKVIEQPDRVFLHLGARVVDLADQQRERHVLADERDVIERPDEIEASRLHRRRGMGHRLADEEDRAFQQHGIGDDRRPEGSQQVEGDRAQCRAAPGHPVDEEASVDAGHHRRVEVLHGFEQARYFHVIRILHVLGEQGDGLVGIVRKQVPDDLARGRP